MTKFLTALFSVFILVLTSTSWAAPVPPIPPQPEKCPDIAPIQSAKFTAAKILPDGTYAAIQEPGSYQTSQTWAFIVYKIPASSPQEALKEAQKSLLSLSFDSGPIYYSDYKVWSCFYNSLTHQSVAITPLPSKVLNTELLLKSARIIQ